MNVLNITLNDLLTEEEKQIIYEKLNSSELKVESGVLPFIKIDDVNKAAHDLTYYYLACPLDIASVTFATVILPILFPDTEDLVSVFDKLRYTCDILEKRIIEKGFCNNQEISLEL